jgi:hypothetical protein
MTAKKPAQAPPPDTKNTSSSAQPAVDPGTQLPPKAPPTVSEQGDAEPFAAGKGRVDRTGIMPENIRIDPDVTEGHPGYQESGDSEIIPNDRFQDGPKSAQKREA